MDRHDLTRLDGRLALVTGGGAGIGAGIAEALARKGARVIVADSDAERAGEKVAVLREAGHDAFAVVVDVRERDCTESLAAAVREAGGRLDILVNNVGDHVPWGPFLETTEEDWEAVYAVNFQHVLRITRHFLPGMVEQRAGSIINVSSVEAFRGVPHCAVYAAHKAAVVNFTAGLATEVGQYGVRVNGIAPDVTDTPQFPLYRLIAPEFHDQIGNWVPMGRFGTPRDHGELAAFLASDAAGWITGESVRVDGGTMASAGWVRRSEMRFTNVPRNFI
jgi:NAD(P)-dependent dehydrogenase (short-subunit alcohol dehydrogenase family)